MQRVSALHEQHAGLVARAVAIVAVVLLHVLSLFPPEIYTGSWAVFFTALNQSLRFSVPLFLFISGFGLSRKYFSKHLQPLVFLRKRAAKLLPLYLLWSAVLFAGFVLAGGWSPLLEFNWWQHLLFGGIDYHLYFVWIIFQCYLLFAFLPRFGRYGVRWMLGACLVFQIFWFWWLRDLNTGAPDELLRTLPEKFLSDQFQYRLLGNWLFYFLLGVEFGQLDLDRLRSWIWLRWTVGVGVCTGLWWATQDALTLIDQLGVTTYAMGFTRPAVIVLAVGVSVGVVLYAPFASQWWRALGVQVRVLSVVKSLGTHSYLIFLSHTLGLRILSEFVQPHSVGAFPLSTVVTSGLLLSLGLFMSRFGIR